MMPGNLVHVPISSHGGGGGGLPGQGAGGVTTDHQQFIPTSQYQNSLPPHMWTQQVPLLPSIPYPPPYHSTHVDPTDTTSSLHSIPSSLPLHTPFFLSPSPPCNFLPLFLPSPSLLTLAPFLPPLLIHPVLPPHIIILLYVQLKVK